MFFKAPNLTLETAVHPAWKKAEQQPLSEYYKYKRHKGGQIWVIPEEQGVDLLDITGMNREIYTPRYERNSYSVGRYDVTEEMQIDSRQKSVTQTIVAKQQYGEESPYVNNSEVRIGWFSYVMKLDAGQLQSGLKVHFDRGPIDEIEIAVTYAMYQPGFIDHLKMYMSGDDTRYMSRYASIALRQYNREQMLYLTADSFVDTDMIGRRNNNQVPQAATFGKEITLSRILGTDDGNFTKYTVNKPSEEEPNAYRRLVELRTHNPTHHLETIIDIPFDFRPENADLTALRSSKNVQAPQDIFSDTLFPIGYNCRMLKS